MDDYKQIENQPSFGERSFARDDVIDRKFRQHVERQVELLQLRRFPHLEGQERQLVVGNVQGGQRLQREDRRGNVFQAVVL